MWLLLNIHTHFFMYDIFISILPNRSKDKNMAIFHLNLMLSMQFTSPIYIYMWMAHIILKYDKIPNNKPHESHIVLSSTSFLLPHFIAGKSSLTAIFCLYMCVCRILSLSPFNHVLHFITLTHNVRQFFIVQLSVSVKAAHFRWNTLKHVIKHVQRH